MLSISQCVDYIECSYRSSFSSVSPRLDVHHAKVVVLADAFKFFLSESSKGRTPSTKSLKKRMSRAWSRVKQENSINYDWRNLLSIQSQLEHARSMVGGWDSVIAVDFPVVIESSEIVEGVIDGILLKNQDYPNRRYLQVLLFDYTTFASHTSNSPLLRFLASMYDMALRGTKLSRIPRKYMFLKLHSGTVQTLRVKMFEEKLAMSMLDSILSGSGANVYVPTTDSKMCRGCLYRGFCDWCQS